MSLVFAGPSCDDAHLDTRYLKYSRRCSSEAVRSLVAVEVFGDDAASDIERLVVPFVDVDPSDLDWFLTRHLNALRFLARHANQLRLELLTRNVVPIFSMAQTRA